MSDRGSHAPSRHLGTRTIVLILALCGVFNPSHAQTNNNEGDDEVEPLVVTSKRFTEGVVLGEIARLSLIAEGVPAVHRRELGGTRVTFNALANGEVDIYAEYTGTLTQEILQSEAIVSNDELASALRERGLGISKPLGFDNSFALGVRPETAKQLDLATISDLTAHTDLQFGLSTEFMNRGDGWPALKRAYGLPHRNVQGIDHDLAYRAVADGNLDVIDLYTTDAEIAYYGLIALKDDRQFFPRYECIWLYRLELERTHPEAIETLNRLAGSIDEATIQRLNAEVKIDGRPEQVVVSEYLQERYGIAVDVEVGTATDRITRRTVEHLVLVLAAMSLATVIAIPLGIVAAYRPVLGQALLAGTGILQTIPSLALLVFMMPLLGTGAKPAIAALFLYCLLPMVRNTITGLQAIPLPLQESAEALGLSPPARLWRISLPLASRSILDGVKTSTILCIGFATLGALIGAGGYGQSILTGIRLDKLGLILEGAVPAALMAVLAQGLFEGIERLVVPRGLRLKRTI